MQVEAFQKSLKRFPQVDPGNVSTIDQQWFYQVHGLIPMSEQSAYAFSGLQQRVCHSNPLSLA